LFSKPVDFCPVYRYIAFGSAAAAGTAQLHHIVFMNISKSLYLLAAVAAFLMAYTVMYMSFEKAERAAEAHETGEAEQAFSWWYAQRAQPYDHIPPKAFATAFGQYQKTFKDPASKYHLREVSSTPQWES